MSAADDTPGTSSPSREQADALAHVVERVRSHSGPCAPVVVFDLDATLFDNRPRTLAILRELRDKLLQAGQDQELADALGRLEIPHLRYLVKDSLAQVGMSDPKQVKRATSFWFARFFRDRYIKHDVPSPGALAFAHACFDAGANLVYLTGRDLPGMLSGTVKKLRDEAFPYAVAGTQVILKPQVKTSDEAFKRAVMPTLRRLGEPVAFFDNEPSNCNIARELLPDADVYWLDTQCVPDAPALVSGVGTLRDFRRAP